MANVLIAVTDNATADYVGLNLRNSGFATSFAQSSQAASQICVGVAPDLVLLDAELQGQSRLEMLRLWRGDRRLQNLAIIVLSTSAEEADKVGALDFGADDYLSRPFSSRELLARIRSVLRRRAPHVLDSPIQTAGLTLFPAMRRVEREGREIKLSPSEFRLLHFLMTHPDHVHARAYLLDKVWGDHVFVEERIVDTHVKRIRQALAEVGCSNLIQTVRGAGYRVVGSGTNN